MLVRMNTTARGADFNADEGQLAEVPDDVGQQLIDGGYAEPAEVVLDREAFEQALEAEAPAPRDRRRATAVARETR